MLVEEWIYLQTTVPTCLTCSFQTKCIWTGIKLKLSLQFVSVCVCLVESTALPYRLSIGNSQGHCPSSSLCSTFYTIQKETLAAILQKNGNENSSPAPVSHPVGRKVTPLVWDWCAKSDCRRLLLLLPEGAHGEPSFTLECKRFDILCTFLWLFSFVCVCVFCVWSQ